ncbi:hypothetical protein L1987_75345 [Smallanthus sonchifolius]|uniref:Uncharacterized protein n=1 Tax=Smallanthus sonchifolius TaxID=185202 RepID=A0ACB9A5Q1_9ASTR|nr:hypothetical protein L1987_75345 [Smallanthus sonchifolius]
MHFLGLPKQNKESQYSIAGFAPDVYYYFVMGQMSQFFPLLVSCDIKLAMAWKKNSEVAITNPRFVGASMGTSDLKIPSNDTSNKC